MVKSVSRNHQLVRVAIVHNGLFCSTNSSLIHKVGIVKGQGLSTVLTLKVSVGVGGTSKGPSEPCSLSRVKKLNLLSCGRQREKVQIGCPK
jgi:hypothetical protein